MKKLLVTILILSTTNSFSFSKEFEIQDSKNKKQSVSLNFLAGVICYKEAQKELIMFSYFGGNKTEEFFNSCAVVEYKAECLGKIVPSLKVDPKFEETFCLDPVKFKMTGEKILYKSFTDKFACKKQFDELVRSGRGSGGRSMYCPNVKKGELIDQFADFDNENKKGIADEK
ncbi:MAG: hypothetical protein QF441_01010 [Bacteriovoracaceae bacterium]|jgi:hypothetical protein|nr:hypothetical protein [Halobacteriovoraceae bacterium]MDP7319149.1 hypothetical protein [Bacteriovoracaceae bacterium]|tara:strand:+ start:331 stop:846 length:516 start_codon:yes stop_codon:yes gene_type:complete